jgi:hypothetical protein
VEDQSRIDPIGRPIMHMTMRKYRQLKGTPEAAVVWVKKNLMPILKKSKGFKA